VTKTTHHRIVVTRRGGPDVLEFVEAPLPVPQAGEARVRVEAAGVSAYDVMLRGHRFPGFPKVPYTPGCDVVGVVDDVGSGANDLVVGQRVAASTGLGNNGYAEFVCLPTETLVPVPEGIDPAEAVCLPANYLTAHLAMHGTAHVESGEQVLVHGAAGGVGSALLELGTLAGLEMYGTASKRNHPVVEKLGATPIDYRADDFVERVRAFTGDGVDVVFDPIGGWRQLWRSHRALRRGGRLVWFGVAATKKSGIGVIPASLAMQGLLSIIPDGRHAPLMANAGTMAGGENAWYRRTLAELLDYLAAGKIAPVVAGRIPLAEASRAHELIERGGYSGKVVLITA
jgi:NADPH:quinone reductase-like Zn-dependent oxidoreductase